MIRMKFLISFLLYISCTNVEDGNLEKDVFISAIDDSIYLNGKATLKKNYKAIYFSRDFWNYFFQSHPKICGILFISPMYDTANHNVLLQDTSWQYKWIDPVSRMIFDQLLADSVTQMEKESLLGSAFFVTSGDSTEEDEDRKVSAIEAISKNTSTILESEYLKLKNILTGKDRTHSYVLVYKKTIAEQLLREDE